MLDARQVHLLSKDAAMQRQQKIMKQSMIQQYYKYISLLRLTNNFQKRLQTYQNIDFKYYQGSMAILGSLQQIQLQKNQQYKDYCFPIIQTPIDADIFRNKQKYLIKRQVFLIRRKLIVSNTNYRRKLVVPFNKIINTCKKQKQQIFMFTHLKMYLTQTQICFGLTDNSSILQLNSDFYKHTFLPLQISLDFNYSELSLNRIFGQGQAPPGTTFIITDLNCKVHDNISNLTILGVLKSINHTLTKVNAKQKQVAVEIIQDVYPFRNKSVGICRVFVRFDIIDSDEMDKHLQIGCVYVLCIKDIVVNDSININYKLNHWKKNFIKITNNPIKLKTLNQRYREMATTELRELINPFIYRNKMKFRVVKYQLKLMLLRVNCEKCQGYIIRLAQNQYRCKRDCGEVRGHLKLWAIVSVMDSTCLAELDLQDEMVLSFFSIEDQQEKMKDQFFKQDTGMKQNIVLYNKKRKDDFGDKDLFVDGFLYNKNQYFHKLTFKCLIATIQKYVVGVPKHNMNQKFQNCHEDIKNQYQIGFAKSNQYTKKVKVFANGNIRHSENGAKLVPYIKVDTILNIK